MTFQDRRAAPKGLVAAAIFLGLAMPGAAPAAETPQAGVAAAVRGEVSRTPVARPGAAEVMAVGQDVFMQDRLKSAAESRAQLLLLDQSSFTVGPNSDLVIDEFVYDPATNSGKLVANVARGTLRFVSGGIGKLGADRITIRTEVSVIGIRGTIALRDEARDTADRLTEEKVILAGPGGKNNANAKPGEITVTAAGKTVTISRTGWGTTVVPGQPPTEPAPMTPAAVQAVNDRLNAGIAQAQQGTGPVPSGVSLEGDESATQAAGDAAATTVATAGGVQETSASFNSWDKLVTDQSDFDPSTGSSFCCFAGSSAVNNLGQVVSDLSTVQQLSGGTVSAGATGLPLVNLALAPTGSTTGGSLFIPDLTGLPVLGTYDYSFTANLSTKTYTISLSGATAPSLGVFGASISQTTTFPTSGVGFLDFGVGGTGVTADANCVTATCSVQNDLLNIGGNPVGGISHRLRVGNTGLGGTLLGAASLLTTSGP